MKSPFNRRMEQSIAAFFFTIFVALFPILPSYTRLMGYTVYLWLAIFTFGILVLLYNKDLLKIPKRYFVISMVVIFLYAIPLGFHMQLERIVYELLDVWLPITIVLLGVRHSTSKQIEKLISILIAISALLCVSGIIEEVFSFNVFSLIENMAYENPNFGSLPATRFGMVRIEQSFNTALTYALYLLMTFGLTFYRFFSRRKKGYVVIMVLQCVNIVLTFTRGVSLVFFLGTILLLLFCKKEIGLNRVLGTILTVLICISVAFIIFPQIQEFIANLFGSAIGLLLGSNEISIDQSSLMRQGFQSVAFEALESPLVFIFGVGEYGLRDMVSIDNEWLLEITGYGILGATGFVILLLTPILYSAKGIVVSQRNSNKSGTLLYKCLLCMFLEYAISLYTVAQMAEARMFYILFGIACAYNAKAQKGETE